MTKIHSGIYRDALVFTYFNEVKSKKLFVQVEHKLVEYD